jgi:hypothetical protein
VQEGGHKEKRKTRKKEKKKYYAEGRHALWAWGEQVLSKNGQFY